MFTGIIETVGTIISIDNHGGDKSITISATGLKLEDLKIGDSIAVNGICLTITELNGNQFSVDVSAETLSCTTFHAVNPGSKVNLEKALRLSDRLHGHLVSGHVDVIGVVKERVKEARSEKFRIEYPESIQRYIGKKGSVCVDGVSLTINEKQNNSFLVNIIPYTMQNTIFAEYQPGTRINIEVDLIARYLEILSVPT
jgi:riboflavin synthase